MKIKLFVHIPTTIGNAFLFAMNNSLHAALVKI